MTPNALLLLLALALSNQTQAPASLTLQYQRVATSTISRTVHPASAEVAAPSANPRQD